MNNQQQIMADATDFRRLEAKVDKITEALNKLVLVEERQTNQGIELAEIKKELAIEKASRELLDKELSRWVNRGIGVWLAVGTILSLFVTYYETFRK